MTQFRTRRMEPDDEARFNDVFNSVVAGVRPPRSLDVMRHIWHRAPGGPVRSWLVEAKDSGGTWQIIGHHGLCPLRFTMGETDLVFAKIVNTFLLPEFRNKFVYLRFERQCLEEVEQVFDATYTLTPAGIRSRAVLGYETTATLTLEKGAHPFELGARVLARLERRYPNFATQAVASSWISLSAHLSPRPKIVLAEHDNETSATHSFFADFWREARTTAGLAPRRDSADLDWRFWSTTDARRTTLTHTWPDGLRAYCIVNRNRPFRFVLEDICLTAPAPDQLQQFLDAVCDWCTRQGALMISFLTAPEGQPQPPLEVFRRNMSPELSRRYRNSPMSRRLTARGQTRIGPTWPPCNITAAVAPA